MRWPWSLASALPGMARVPTSPVWDFAGLGGEFAGGNSARVGVDAAAFAVGGELVELGGFEALDGRGADGVAGVGVGAVGLMFFLCHGWDSFA